MPMSTITVGGIDPGLNILGATQQFNYTQLLSAFQITNSFIPTIGMPSLFNMEYRNNTFSGFRWTHKTISTDTHGSLALQSFVNAQAFGIDIITILGNGNLSISTEINLNNNKIRNVDTPELPLDAANKAYADSVISAAATANLYMENNVVTNIIVTPNAFQKINGTTVSRFLTDFTMPLGNRLLYTGITTLTALISVNVTLSGTAADCIYAISVYKNGASQIAALTRQQLVAGNIGTLVSIVPVQFATNDYIEIFVTASLASTITVENLNVSIT